MKRFKNIFLVLLCTVPMLFASCDDDDDYYYHYWYDDSPGYGYPHSWRDYGYNDDDGNSSDRLNMAKALANKWSGILIAYNTVNGVEERDSFEIDLDFQQTNSNAAAGICTENSWPVINGVTQGDTARHINTYVWYINDDMDIQIVYSDGMKALIDHDELFLGEDKVAGTVFDGTMRWTGSSDYVKFWTNLYKEVSNAKGTRAANSKLTKLVFVPK